MEWLTSNIEVAITSIVTGLAGAFASWFYARKKQRAEVQASELDNVEKATSIWRELAEDLKNEVKDLRAGQEKLHNENQELKKLVSSLKRELANTRKQLARK